MEDFNYSIEKKKYNNRDYYINYNYPFTKKYITYENRVIFLANKLSLLYGIKINKYKPMNKCTDIKSYYTNQKIVLNGKYDFHWFPCIYDHLFEYIYYLKNIFLEKNNLPIENYISIIKKDFDDMMKKNIHGHLICELLIDKYGTQINDLINDLDSKIEKCFEEKFKKQKMIDEKVIELQEIIRKKHEHIDITINELTKNVNLIEDSMKLFVGKLDEVLENNQKMNEQLQQCMYNQAQLIKIVKMMFMFSKTHFGDVFSDEQMKAIENFI